MLHREPAKSFHATCQTVAPITTRIKPNVPHPPRIRAKSVISSSSSSSIPQRAHLPAAKMTFIQRAKKLDIGCFVNIKTIRDHTKRKAFAEFEAQRQALRYAVRNTTLPPRTRAIAQLQLSQMHCYTRPTQIRNRCILGGKGRGVFSDFKMTRYNFRLNALAGNLPGVKKASW